MKNEILPSISREDYNAINALNISLLVEGDRSMAHLKYAIEHKRESTPAMEKGTALHLAVFEPAEFEKRVAVYDGIKRGKEWNSFYENCSATLILKPDVYASIISMRDALHNHPRVKELLESKGTGEIGAVWQDKDSGIWCKGLIDRFCQCWGYSVILDLKTCQDARPSEFAKTIYNFHYHTKAAWYLDGLKAIADVDRRFLWIAIESEPFHGISIFDVGDEMMEVGRKNYKRLLSEYAKCKELGVWPSYPLGEESLELPKWAKG